MPDNSEHLDGLHVAAFESRRAKEMSRFIQKLGGVPHVSPSMREVPLDNNSLVIDFAKRLVTGQIDLLILMTGVGIRHFVGQVERHLDRHRLLAAMADVTTVARGPKPVAALRELDIQPTHCVPEPNTWREVLSTIDAHCAVASQSVGLQEYGETNASLIAGLEARGATVVRLKVYDWDLPEDTGPLEANVRALADGSIEVALFTSATQVSNLMKVAEGLEMAEALRVAFREIAVGSIGPTTSERLRHHELPVDFEPEHPKMGHLVQAAAAQAAQIGERKKRIALTIYRPPDDKGAPTENRAWDESLFMKACRCEPVERTPVWLMRQAGRYMSEYRAIREKTSFLDLCKNPQLCSEVMVTAVERLGVDAAIVFADLLPILEPMGMDLEFAQGDGPVIHNPVRESTDVRRVLELENVDSLHFVMEAVRQTRSDLPEQLPLIGFAGAPFTLASYAIEGGGSRNFLHTKTLMYRDAAAWNALLGRLVRAISMYLNAQIAAGAQAVQLFDSWIGCLSPEDYRRYVLPHMRELYSAITGGVPVIHFGTGNPALLPLMREAGGSVMSVDWRITLGDAWQTIGYDMAIQGNLDPLVLLAPHQEIRRRAQEVLDQAAGRPGHIFNLGHGILPQTPVDSAIALIDAVHELSSD